MLMIVAQRMAVKKGLRTQKLAATSNTRTRIESVVCVMSTRLRSSVIGPALSLSVFARDCFESSRDVVQVLSSPTDGRHRTSWVGRTTAAMLLLQRSPNPQEDA